MRASSSADGGAQCQASGMERATIDGENTKNRDATTGASTAPSGAARQPK